MMSKTAEYALDNLCRSLGRSEQSEMQRAMQRACDDATLRAIVNDHRTSVFGQSEAPSNVKVGSGWVEPKPLRPPEGVEHCDRIADAFDRRDRAKGLL
jgi:hypothetical protein